MPTFLLIGLFVALPILEIYVIVQVGSAIGALPTVLLLVVEALLGGWLVRREGKRAWEALRTATSTGRMPGRELADAALVLVGGTLLLTPGFVTDIFGFFFVLPFTRPLARRVVSAVIARRAAREFDARYAQSRRGAHQIHQPGEEGGTSPPDKR
jgi:UPF0716 protein FxsA